MSRISYRNELFLSLLPAALVAFGGCSKDASKEQAKDKTTSTEAKKADDSGTWWCKEHGMPEEVCAQCNAKVAAEFKKKGDWCKEHDRPDSQCFVCHPELEAKFAAQYEAKYGKQPPKPQG